MYIKHDKTVHTARVERNRKEITVTLWIVDKHLYIRYPKSIKLTNTFMVSNSYKALALIENYTTHTTDNYQVAREDNLIKIPAKYARCRQRDHKKVKVPATLLLLDPAYSPTYNPDVDLGAYNLVIDCKHIP